MDTEGNVDQGQLPPVSFCSQQTFKSKLETEDTTYRKFLVIRQLFTAMTTACALSRFFANCVMQNINDAF